MNRLEVYVARQPIFDREMNLYGYELLYRKSENNFFEGIDDDRATAAVLANSVLVMNFNHLIDRTRGFINFPQNFLTHELPRLLPPQKVVVEILETVAVTKEVIAACKMLKSYGYTLALDDFTLHPDYFTSGLIDLVDIIKIEYPRISLSDQQALIQRYQSRILFLAEKIESAEDYEQARTMGYKLFQGYFFSKPMILNRTDIPTLNESILKSLRELKRKEPDFYKMSKWLAGDVGLSYKIIRLSNLAGYGSILPIRSIRQALARIGISDLRQWMNVMLLQDLKSAENNELIKMSTIRGKMLAQLAHECGQEKREPVFLITGLFSSLDDLLNDSMAHIVQKLSLTDEVSRALLGEKNDLRMHLDALLSFERADWPSLGRYLNESEIPFERYMQIYLNALNWQQTLSF
ncbi:EAL and HDOD domain-containing protein [Sporolactobacillus spathodeae]|uniref:EAL and modified HD-GYP domain-containing signal transduction protein n=1 Tax=Sporolactobacillus spathodeae TaxID=1465502 RepID=A0ABS2Q9S7_9BACL|nr:EAL domain-containing protein [Sporolactobacillus spathodeae]MBM7658483.1 EAL and modified HD-GYP domain-containing signal transduction protein [Sporolactobacillus spathodeae]